jgi:hypothetical protein
VDPTALALLVELEAWHPVTDQLLGFALPQEVYRHLAGTQQLGKVMRILGETTDPAITAGRRGPSCDCDSVPRRPRIALFTGTSHDTVQCQPTDQPEFRMAGYGSGAFTFFLRRSGRVASMREDIDYRAALDTAHRLATSHLDGIGEQRVAHLQLPEAPNPPDGIIRRFGTLKHSQKRRGHKRDGARFTFLLTVLGKK